jgi:(p)ppGpp synthase/HD superfamily hydrolase
MSDHLGLVYRAMSFAQRVHIAQKRKYTEAPYFTHLAEVAGIVSSVASDYPESMEMLAVAWLHDTIEDQGVTSEEIGELFGPLVMRGVLALSDLEIEGNRAARKAAARKRLSNAPAWVQTIKMADLISNTPSIMQNDPKFARVYVLEAKLLILELTLADERLVNLLKSLLD